MTLAIRILLITLSIVLLLGIAELVKRLRRVDWQQGYFEKWR